MDEKNDRDQSINSKVVPSLRLCSLRLVCLREVRDNPWLDGKIIKKKTNGNSIKILCC